MKKFGKRQFRYAHESRSVKSAAEALGALSHRGGQTTDSDDSVDPEVLFTTTKQSFDRTQYSTSMPPWPAQFHNFNSPPSQQLSPFVNLNSAVKGSSDAITLAGYYIEPTSGIPFAVYAKPLSEPPFLPLTGGSSLWPDNVNSGLISSSNGVSFGSDPEFPVWMSSGGWLRTLPSPTSTSISPSSLNLIPPMYSMNSPPFTLPVLHQNVTNACASATTTSFAPGVTTECVNKATTVRSTNYTSSSVNQCENDSTGDNPSVVDLSPPTAPIVANVNDPDMELRQFLTQYMLRHGNDSLGNNNLCNSSKSCDSSLWGLSAVATAAACFQ